MQAQTLSPCLSPAGSRARPALDLGSALDRARRAGASYRCFVDLRRIEDIAARPGPLAGLTYAAKDMFETAGRPPTLGLAAGSDIAPTRTAEALRILDENGAVRVGYASMTALAYEPSGTNPVQGRPVNPRDPDRICGGSSSGSAAAVAADAVSFAVGSDTAGSLRIPAHCCGVPAWKPSVGLVPTDGAMPLAPSLDAIGFLAADPAVLARLGDVFGATPTARIRRVLLARDVIAGSTPPIRRAIGRAARSLPADTGEIDLLPLIAACDEPCLAILEIEAARAHAGRLESGALEPVLARRLAKGRTIPAERAREAYAVLEGLRASAPAFPDRETALLLPVMRIPSPPVAVCEPGSPLFSARTLYELSALTRFVNLLGCPAVAVPVGLDDGGAPVAAQLVGPVGSDAALLGLAVEWHRSIVAAPAEGGTAR